MELAVNTLNVEMTSEAISQIKQKARKVFSRVSDNIMAVKLTLDDVNGPKGGRDKKCMVIVHCHGMPSVVASNNEQSIIGAVNLALTKAHTALVKKIKRSQTNRPQFKKAEEDETIAQIREEYINKKLG
ncbi:hypothetical protein SG34_031740 [Thalassomonas viridans]|uniref:30S ribosomal protein S30 n=1 Tax=Thalassomonas viridans TaxID=137584 RepID=A0AAE9Z930_9GAMM|nr:hypothetical protein [Thalassomonas viridans]WDE08497.1 hypothetical protein SG34_031740 [Thalassomonas viridans]